MIKLSHRVYHYSKEKNSNKDVKQKNIIIIIVVIIIMMMMLMTVIEEVNDLRS